MAQSIDTLIETSHEDDVKHLWPVKEQALHIILVDMYKLTRLALQRVVAEFPGVHIAANLSTIDEVHMVIAMSGLSAAHTSVLVLGPSIPVSDCLTIVKQIRAQQASGGVVVMQQHLQPETVRTLVEQGVQGLLDECASEQDLYQAIRAASLGNIFLSRRTRSMLAVSMSRSAGHLTEREIQVLSRLKYGESNGRIARGLGLKEKTIEKYLTNIYDKLNVHSRAEALLYLQKLHF